jgi:hypothetical protein
VVVVMKTNNKTEAIKVADVLESKGVDATVMENGKKIKKKASAKAKHKAPAKAKSKVAPKPKIPAKPTVNPQGNPINPGNNVNQPASPNG